MAANAKLSAALRQENGKGAARKLRAQGRIPAVIYGHGERTRSVTLDAHELDRLLASVHYENTVVRLDVEGEKREVRALLRDVQRHPSRQHVLHVDLLQIHKGEKVQVSIPVRLVGSAPGVRAGGLLQHATTDIEIRCVADNIPEHIDVDVSALEIGDSVHVRDLVVPAGTEVLEDGDRTICSLAPPAVAVAEEEAEEPEVETGEPEVIRRAREEEEDEG
jgi:large subunit ribosomal protein L25